MSDVASVRDISSASTLASIYRRPSPLSATPSAAARRASSRNWRPVSQRTDQSSRLQVLREMSIAKLENTYRMEPDDRERFHPDVVQEMLGSLLESFLDGELYEARKCSQIAQNLTEVIKARMKELPFPRYKFVCTVTIGQNAGQCVSVASRSLCNASTDNFASATYRNGSLFAAATVFAVYFE